jgi:uncharacterized protein YkwD
MIVNRGKGPIALALASVAALCLIAVGAPTTAAPGQSGTSISATVSATGSFTRTNTYTWTLNQAVSPSSAQLAIGKGQKFTHTLTACRALASQVDTNFDVTGQVCVKNGGSVATTGLNIVVTVQDQIGSAGYQDLAGTQTAPPVADVPAGQTGCFGYSISFKPVTGASSYRVVATVTVTNHSGTQTSGPSPKFSLTSPQVVNVDDKATVTDTLTPLSCGGFTTSDSFTSPSTVSVGTKGCATMTFTVTVANASATGTAACPLMDTATLITNTTGTQISAPATVTVSSNAPCNQTETVNSCLQDEGVLKAVLSENGQQASFLQDLLSRINQARASASVPPLTRIVPLESAAQGYSATLVGTDPTMLSHFLDGDPQTRAVTAGYDPMASVGENLAAGQWSAEEVVNAWLNSTEHRTNMLNPNFTQVGLGLSGGSFGSDTFVLYWVADFGGSTQSFDAAGGGGTPLDARMIATQLHTLLQQTDADLCAGHTDAVNTDVQNVVNYWLGQGLISDVSQSEIVGVCLQGVLGFYAAASGVSYTTTISYIQANLVLG